jgi:hypothetical protein
MIRQLHYTSCRTGRDGIQGFQVAAATPDTPSRHEDLALPLAAYRPPPSAPALPSAAEIAAMPVALGFRDFGEVAVLFRSHYLGEDFTGRQGNYFAHVLLADRPAADLAGVVAAATWEAPYWAHGPRPAEAGTTLAPFVGPLSGEHPNTVADPVFPALLAAVRDGLTGHVRQIVLVGPPPDPAGRVAAAVLAVTAALPPHLARQVSFTTFSATPQDLDLLVVGTTPDVALGAHTARGRVVLHLADTASGPASAYGTAAERRRAPEALAAFVALGAEIHPPLRLDELDAFAAAAPLLDGVEPDPDPLDGLEFLATRYRSALPVAWERLEAAVTAGAVAFDDLARWSDLLRNTEGLPNTAGRRPALEAAYRRTVLNRVTDGGAPEDVWLPRGDVGADDEAVVHTINAVTADPRPETAIRLLRTLDRMGVDPADADLETISDLVLLPLALDHNDLRPFWELRLAPRLAAVMARQLEERLDDDLVGTAAEGLTPEVARWLGRAADPDGRVATAAALRLAAAGLRDKVDLVAQQAVDPATLDRLLALLWPAQPPSVAEGLALLRRLDPAITSPSGLPARLADRLTADAATESTGEDEALARALLDVRPDVDQHVRACADAVRLTTWFRNNPVSDEDAVARVHEATELRPPVDPALAGPLARALVRWMFAGSDGVVHAAALTLMLDARMPEALPAYVEQLSRTLENAESDGIVEILPPLVHVSASSPGAAELLVSPCADALARRKRRTLDEVGVALSTVGSVPSDLRPAHAANWTAWWKNYRETRVDPLSVGIGGKFQRMLRGR